MSPDDVETWGGWLPPVKASGNGGDAAETQEAPEGSEKPEGDQIGALEGLIDTHEDETGDAPEGVAPADDETGEEPAREPEDLLEEVEDEPEDLGAQAADAAEEELEVAAETEPIEEPEPAEEPDYTCHACGEPCPVGARFCLQCGTPLFAEEATAPGLVTAAVVFEVAGGGSRDDAGGPFERVRAALQRHGASVRPLAGSPDTLAALFDPDLDDAVVRAVRAAAAAREAARGGSVTVRAGVGTCEVEDDPEGEDRSPERAVDLAVRLQRMAAPGEVIVGEAVYRVIGEEVAVEPVDGAARLDGDGPIGPLRLLGVGRGAPVHSLGEAALIGRDSAMAGLREAFDKATADRCGVLVDVVGEAGLGKTRLVEELAGGLEDATVVRIRCRSAVEGGAVWPLAQIVEGAAGLTRRGDDVRAELSRALEGEGGADDIARRLAHVVGLDEAGAAPEETSWAVRRLLEVTARRSPLVLWLDDVDRADDSFHHLLTELAGSVRDAPVLVIRTSAVEPAGATELIRLEPLSEVEVDSLVADLLGNADGIASIARGCGGNPFFLEQILAMLIEQGRLVFDRGRWLAAADAGTTTAAHDVTALLEMRLQALPLDERAVIGLAAVIGEAFPWAPMSELLPEGARSAVRDQLAALVDKHLLRPEGEDTFSFRHPLVREAALATVPDDARAEVHERFARHLEQSAGARDAELVGAHLASAARLRPGLPHAERDELARRAVGLLASAARRAAELGDTAGAARLFARASSLLPDAAAERPELLLRAAMASADADDLREAERAAAESARVARSLEDRAAEWRARVFRAGLRIRSAEYFGVLENARTTADQAIERFAELGDDWGLAWAWALRGLVHRSRGHTSAFTEIAQRVAEHSRRAGRRREEIASLRDLARAIADGPAPVGEAMDHCERIAEQIRDDRLAEQDVLGVLALLRARRGAFGDARELAAGALSLTEDVGSPAELATCLYRTAQIEALAEDHEAAEDLFRRALDAAERSGDGRIRSHVAAALGHVACERGRAEEGLDMAEAAERFSVREDIASQVGWRTAHARALALLRRLDEADELARQAVRLAEQTDSAELRAGALLDLAEVLRLSGRPNEAAPFVKRSLRLFDRKGSSVRASHARRLLEQLEAHPERPE